MEARRNPSSSSSSISIIRRAKIPSSSSSPARKRRSSGLARRQKSGMKKYLFRTLPSIFCSETLKLTRRPVRMTVVGLGPPVDATEVESLMSSLSAYAKALLQDPHKRKLVRTRCKGGGALEVKALECGIKAVELAIRSTSMEERVAKLLAAERLLSDLQVPNGNGYIVGWACLYLALLWQLRSGGDSRRRTSLHLLKMFSLCPQVARQGLAGELWEDLFRPHFGAIEAWYKKECTAILTSEKGSVGSIIRPSPVYPISSTKKKRQTQPFTNLNYSHTPQVASSKEEHAVGVDDDDAHFSDKLMQLHQLNKLREEVLNESTQQYAEYYQSLLASYEDEEEEEDEEEVAESEGESNCEVAVTELQKTPSSAAPSSSSSSSPQRRRLSIVSHAASYSDNEQFCDEHMSANSSEDWAGFQQHAPIRRSLLEAVLGTNVPKIDTSAFHQIQLTSTCYEDMDEVGKLNMARQLPMPKEVTTDVRKPKLSKTKNLSKHVKGDKISVEEKNVIQINHDDLHESNMIFDNQQQFQTSKKATMKRLIDVLQDPHVELSPPYQLVAHRLNDINSGFIEKRVDADFTTKESSFLAFTSRLEEETAALRLIDSREALILSDPATSFKNHGDLNVRGGKSSSPKVPNEFVCKLTNSIFTDPVTLDTGATFERSAIKKWFDAGNRTCPVTKKTLDSAKLPMTNLVLKRLCEKWKEENRALIDDHQDEQEGQYFTASEESFDKDEKGLTIHYGNVHGAISSNTTPQANRYSEDVSNIVVGSSSNRRIGNLLGEAVTGLGDGNLRKREEAVLRLAHFWTESKGNPSVETWLIEAGVIMDGLIDILLTSKNEDVLKASLCLLAALVVKDHSMRDRLLETGTELETIFAIAMARNLSEAALFLYFLNPTETQLYSLDVLPLLLNLVKNNKVGDRMKFPSPLTPREVVLFLMERMVTGFDSSTNHANCKILASSGSIPHILDQIESDKSKERLIATSVIIRCMQTDSDCRHFVATNFKASSIVKLLYANSVNSIITATSFLMEVLRLNRSIAVTILLSLRQVGSINIMHILMAFLQRAPLEYRPLAAGLLFQLDLLEPPCKYSIFREEAVDALVEALSCEENTNAQTSSAQILATIGGRFAYSGDSLVETWLMNKAGILDPIMSDHECNKESENMLWAETKDEMEMSGEEWERRAAVALMVYTNIPALMRALGRHLCSNNNIDVARLCLIATTWFSCFFGAGSEMEMEMEMVVKEEIQPGLMQIMQPDETNAIESRVFAALALQNFKAAHSFS